MSRDAGGWGKRTAVELGISEEADKVGAVFGLDVVALQMQGDVSEGSGIAVDVEGLDGAARVLVVFLGVVQLAEEVLGEVGRRCRQKSATHLVVAQRKQGGGRRGTRVWSRARALTV